MHLYIGICLYKYNENGKKIRKECSAKNNKLTKKTKQKTLGYLDHLIFKSRAFIIPPVLNYRITMKNNTIYVHVIQKVIYFQNSQC